MKRLLLNLVRLLLILAGVGYIIYTVNWVDVYETPAGASAEAEPVLVEQGMLTVVREASWSLLAAALAIVSVVYPLQAYRWWLLLRCRGLGISWLGTLRLVLIGAFFNFCVPLGSNGGDVVKAYGAAKAVKGSMQGARSIAVISVLLDRVSGLLGLLLLAGLLAPLMWDQPAGRSITVISWSILLGFFFFTSLYFNASTRRWLGLDALGKVKGVRKIDEALSGYREHRGALLAVVGISLPVHICLSLATALAGLAVGAPTPVIVLMTILPVVFLVGALPLGLMGLGFMEATAYPLFSAGEAGNITVNQVVAMLNAYRGALLTFGLIGAGVMLFSGLKIKELTPDESEQDDPLVEAAEIESHTTPL
jgi:uncharacterized protein (TIRG00374 family)